MNVEVKRNGPIWQVTCNGQVLGAGYRRRSALRMAESVSLITERMYGVHLAAKETSDD